MSTRTTVTSTSTTASSKTDLTQESLSIMTKEQIAKLYKRISNFLDSGDTPPIIYSPYLVDILLDRRNPKIPAGLPSESHFCAMISDAVYDELLDLGLTRIPTSSDIGDVAFSDNITFRPDSSFYNRVRLEANAVAIPVTDHRGRAMVIDVLFYDILN